MITPRKEYIGAFEYVFDLLVRRINQYGQSIDVEEYQEEWSILFTFLEHLLDDIGDWDLFDILNRSHISDGKEINGNLLLNAVEEVKTKLKEKYN
jgi:hypothetical protein